MDRTVLYYAIADLDVDDDIKEVLEMFIDFIDYEDERTHSESVKKMRGEIKELRDCVYELEEEAVVK